MSKIKKILSIILCLTIIFAFGACSKNASNSNGNAKPNIICTTFPQYDWVRNILGDKANDVDLTLLLDNGIDLHNYQPTVDDLAKISKCDMFIYVGGESDEWVDDALANATNENMVVVNLLEVIGDNAKEEEIKEGMEAEEEEGEDGEEEEIEYDEHIWLSLKNSITLCNVISDKLISIDKENEATYSANTESYIKALRELDNKYQNVCDNAKTKTVLFGDRFPFRYMVDDYGLDYYAAFVGCSAETEASFETIKFLSDKVDELGLKTVLTIEGTDHKIAETIVNSTKDKNQQILSLDSLQSVTSEDVNNGVSYLSVMEDNLAVLEKALA